MIRFAKDESLRGLDEWDDSLCEWDVWMNGMKTLLFQDG
jgi:hypothetical protein